MVESLPGPADCDMLRGQFSLPRPPVRPLPVLPPLPVAPRPRLLLGWLAGARQRGVRGRHRPIAPDGRRVLRGGLHQVPGGEAMQGVQRYGGQGQGRNQTVQWRNWGITN